MRVLLARDDDRARAALAVYVQPGSPSAVATARS